jgi:hypothetical protein
MIRVFSGQRLVHEDPGSSDLQVGIQRVRVVDPTAFDPTAVPTWDAPGANQLLEQCGTRAVRRMIGSNGEEYLVVASDD